MVDKQRFDELYRARIRRVRYPAPPELDWDELARTAAASRAMGRGAGIAWGVSLAVAVTAVGALLWYGSPDPILHGPRANGPKALPHLALEAPAEGVTTAGTLDQVSAPASTVEAIVPVAPLVSSPVAVVTPEMAANGAKAPSIAQYSGEDEALGTIEGAEQDRLDQASDAARIDHMDLLPTGGSPLNASPISAPRIDIPHPVFPRWSISPWFSLDHVDRVDDKDRDEGLLSQVSADNGMRSTTGLRVRFAWDERLSVYTGAQLSWKGALKGTIQTSAVQKAEYDLSGRYLEIPIGLRFSTNRERWSAYARAGIQLQFNLRPGEDHIVLYNYALKEMRTVRLGSSSMGVSGEFAAGVEFRAGKRMAVFVEPVYRLGFTPVVQQSYYSDLPLNPKERSFGLATGLVYHLSIR